MLCPESISTATGMNEPWSLGALCLPLTWRYPLCFALSQIAPSAPVSVQVVLRSPRS